MLKADGVGGADFAPKPDVADKVLAVERAALLAHVDDLLPASPHGAARVSHVVDRRLGDAELAGPVVVGVRAVGHPDDGVTAVELDLMAPLP